MPSTPSSTAAIKDAIVFSGALFEAPLCPIILGKYKISPPVIFLII
jgi:hypothetical protein